MSVQVWILTYHTSPSQSLLRALVGRNILSLAHSHPIAFRSASQFLSELNKKVLHAALQQSMLEAKNVRQRDVAEQPVIVLKSFG